MQTTYKPFNLTLLDLNNAVTKNVGIVKSLDYFDPTNGEYHSEGLFSTEIFGQLGDNSRQLKFGLIDVKVQIFHPLIYRALCNLRGFYKDLISGKRYAVWNEKEKDFEESDPFDGETGFTFFVRHWKDINFKRTGSYKRDDRIQLIEKFKDVALQSKVVVMPAGLRDIQIQDDGRIVADEINDLYHRVISVSNTISPAALRNNPEILDNSRHKLNLAFNQVYDHIEGLVKGKKKFFMAKYASRRIQDGTRNVISSLPFDMKYLGDNGDVTMNHTVFGLHQTMIMIRPVTIHRLLFGILSDIFISPDVPARLINKDTLEQEEVQIDSDVFDYWRTSEGLVKVMNAFKHNDIRHKPIIVNDHYLALVYKDDRVFKIFNDIRELPEDKDRKFVTPITLAELLYHALYPVANEYPCFMTRYPIAGVGSIYPSKIYLKTTVQSESLHELDDNWEIDGDKPRAREFPIKDLVFHDTASPHSAHLAAAVGDFDGDMMSCTALYTDESLEAMNRHFELKRAYVGTNGKIKFSVSINPVELVLYNLTEG